MSQHIECALFMPAQGVGWLDDWSSAQSLANRRSHFVPLALARDPSTATLSPLALEARRADLFRFQLCLLPVDPCNLAWVRTALASLASPLPAPLICLCHRLRAEAIGDLLLLGADDFILLGGGVEEVRARGAWRIKSFQRAWRHRHAQQATDSVALAEPSHAYVHGHKRQVPDDAHAGEVSGKRACETSADAGTQEVSFVSAKKAVVDRFECAYLRNALMRHAGNVAGAARASAKHRRAFWALMRKHGISADAYRQGRRARR